MINYIESLTIVGLSCLKSLLFGFHFLKPFIKAIFAKMKWIKNIALLSVLMTVFLVFGKEDKKTFTIDYATKKSIERIDFLKASAFVNPEITQNTVASSRADLPIYAKWFESFYNISFSDFSFFKATAIFARQDINRCLNVSILLFPFHIFW